MTSGADIAVEAAVNRGVTMQPLIAGSASLEVLPAPPASEGAVLVAGLAWGICGTDHDLLAGDYGWAPPGRDRLVLGHESLGRVLEAPDGCGVAPGDLVVGIVRRPDPVPCPACALGEWDMCRNGRYVEHGIKELDGFARQRWRAEPDAVVRVDPALGLAGVLLEPASVVAKAWDHIERIGARAAWSPSTVLVTGAGPIGLLAALLAVQHGYDVHVLDLVTDGPKPRLVDDLGATYHTGAIADLGIHADVIVECTGVAQLVFDAARSTTPAGIACLTGVSTGGRTLDVDVGALNRSLVLQNDVVFGTVNANRRHYELAAEALGKADPDWLHRLLTRRVALDDWTAALERRDDDVKVVVELGG